MNTRLPPRMPPMPQRDRGGRSKIENPDDGTPIRDMFTLDDGLLILTDKCTYRLQMADQIDPKRENPALPQNFQQKLFDHGVNSELLCRTLMQAKVLFRQEFQTIDIAKAKQLAFDALTNLIGMDEEAKAFAAAEKAAAEKPGGTRQDGRSMVVPAVGNVRNHAKSFIQKADHFAHALLKVMRLFYPKAVNWTEFEALIKATYGVDDNFSKLAAELAPILRLVRDARSAMEHNPGNIVVKDFEPQADGKVWVPSLSVRHDKSKLERSSLSAFMTDCVNTLSISFEMLTVHACAKSTQPFAGMPMTIGVLSEEYQKAWHVRFAYGAIYADGQFVPCG